MRTLGFVPRGKFVEISITGEVCPLNCPVCRGRWLKGMASATTPEELVRLGRHLGKKGVKGMLISGGLTREGKLPVKSFIDAIRELKGMGFFLSVHTGVVGEEEAELLSKAGVDLADYELILDAEAIRLSKALPLAPEDFISGMELLLENSVEVVPHLTVGLPGSSEDSFLKASELIKEYGVRRAVVLAFIPTPNTPFQNHSPPEPRSVLRAAEILSRSTKVSMGCMRPAWMKKEIDSLLSGTVDRIANPHPSLGLNIVNACCSIPDELIEEFL